MSIREQEEPVFSYSLRGYDRVQVDDYLAGFREYVVQLEDRAVAAESALVECRRELASPGSAGVSERLAAILQLANEEADEIRAQAQAEGEATTQHAASEAERTVNDANQLRDTIQLEIDDLSTVREVLLQQLVELGNQIRDASARYQGFGASSAPAVHADVELFDAEALDGEAAIADDEPAADADAAMDLLTASGQTPEPS
jgi:cell division septum initiation protein DivIVA